jgi:hypothetical protein
MENEEPKTSDAPKEDPKPVFVGKRTLIVTGSANPVNTAKGQPGSTAGKVVRPE